MIISKEKGSHLLNNRWIKIAVAAVLIGTLVFFFNQRKSGGTLDAFVEMYCDAEHVKGNSFVSNEMTFSAGNLQSEDHARSGKYSCSIPEGKGARFGFGRKTNAFEYGQLYRASVWRYGVTNGAGNLVVQGDADDFYLAEQFSVARENGWERLEIDFMIPEGANIKALNIYVYTNGENAIYFDDLKLEKLDLPKAAFTYEVIDLSIKPKAMKKLETKRAEALQLGLLITEDDDWITAKFQGKEHNESVKIKLRLKGDLTDHLKDDKWSFRVKMGDAAWNRMKTFSLQSPAARHYLHEWILHKFWEKEDILTPRYDLVELRLNGRSLGVYAYEEHFDKQLVEYKKRREGPILKFGEDAFWSGVQRQFEHLGKVDLEQSVGTLEAAEIQAFKGGKIGASPTLLAQYEEAQVLMNQIRNGGDMSLVFDLERMAKYYAITDVLGAYHGMNWHNERFYYNPVLNRFEPIGFDGFGHFDTGGRYSFLGQGMSNPDKIKSSKIFTFLFQNKAFVAYYHQYLVAFTDYDFLNQFFDKRMDGVKARLAVLSNEFPEYEFQKTDFIKGAAYVRTLVMPYNQYSLLTYTQSSTEAQKEITVLNRHNLALEIIGTGQSAETMDYPLNETVIVPAHSPRKVEAHIEKDSLFKNFSNVTGWTEQALKKGTIADYKDLIVNPSSKVIFFKLLGVDKLYTSKINPFKPANDLTAFQNLKATATAIPSFVLQNRKEWLIKSGKYTLENDFVIPANQQLIIESNTTINLLQNAKIISYSPVQTLGTPEAPVMIYSTDKTGQGLTVLQSKEKSELNYTIFDNLTNPRYKGWALTGAVTFYESDVDIEGCSFRNNHCEDGLNVVRSKVSLRNSVIVNTAFDGFDCDFCQGRIEYSQFINTGNDGLDVSGSVFLVENCRFDAIGDKGISAGEESDVTLKNSSISNANIAIASKDLSIVVGRNVDIKNCDQGFVAFQKKSEFGPSRIIIQQYTSENIKRLYTIAEGCTLQIGEEVVNEN